MNKVSFYNNILSHRCRISNDKNNTVMDKNKHANSSKTKQSVIHYITFNELCPIWSKKLSQGLDKVDRFLIEKDSKYCIIGEAWKFSGRYTGYYLAFLIPFVGCWTCIKYARKFANISKKKANVTRSDFESLIEYFMLHWNEKHEYKNKSIQKF
jgi:hypothetical protein